MFTPLTASIMCLLFLLSSSLHSCSTIHNHSFSFASPYHFSLSFSLFLSISFTFTPLSLLLCIFLSVSLISRHPLLLTPRSLLLSSCHLLLTPSLSISCFSSLLSAAFHSSFFQRLIPSRHNSTETGGKKRKLVGRR